ncbi:hypothetical protein ABZ252_02490 [Streptomyces sp. NPDC006175]|uniref:DUF6924 domain-containing protein n=1 Tax=Streptomyces sp. NPDC006175 TaxID=3154471 RepID=UPI00339DDC65
MPDDTQQAIPAVPSPSAGDVPPEHHMHLLGRYYRQVEAGRKTAEAVVATPNKRDIASTTRPFLLDHSRRSWLSAPGGRVLGMTLPENLERVLPEIGRDLFDVLVIRTDFSDDEAWNAVVEELHRPWGSGGEFAAAVQLIDSPAWSGATADEVLAAVVDEDLVVVFLADRGTMKSPARPLLALSTGWEDVSGLDPVYYQELIESPDPREFRALPTAVHGVQMDLALGNVDFAEYAGAASAEPDQVLRPD